MSTSQARTIVYAEGNAGLSAVASSSFTHVILAFIHLNDDPVNASMRILTGVTTIYRTNDFSSYVSSLNAGTFPSALRQASAPGFTALGITLSNDVTVNVVTSGSSWTLVDNVSGAQYPIQISNVWLSWNGGDVYKTTDYSSYVAPLNAGTFPEALREASASGFEADGVTLSNDVTVTTFTPSQEWVLTDNSDGFTWVIKIAESDGAMNLIIWNYSGVYTANNAAFWSEVQAIVAAGTNVLISIGGGGVQGDWTNIDADVQNAIVLVQELIDTYGLAGIDLDYEGDQSSADQTGVTDFINAFAQANPSLIITMAPYLAPLQFYIDVLQGTKTSSGNNVTWLNAQIYEGSQNFDPSAADDFLSAIEQGNIGISNAPAFLATGWNADPNAFPVVGATKIESNIAAVRKAHSNATLAGAFVWNLSFIAGDAGDWAKDMATALTTTRP